jgi:hypothetical protein
MSERGESKLETLMICKAIPITIATTAAMSLFVQVPGRAAHRFRKVNENPTTTLIAVKDPFRKVESMLLGGTSFG